MTSPGQSGASIDFVEPSEPETFGNKFTSVKSQLTTLWHESFSSSTPPEINLAEEAVSCAVTMNETVNPEALKVQIQQALQQGQTVELQSMTLVPQVDGTVQMVAKDGRCE